METSNVQWLVVELATLQHENLNLRRRVERLAGEREYRVDLRIVDRAVEDARHLLALHWAGMETTRDAMILAGWSHRRWRYAVALLKEARLRTQGRPGFADVDQETARIRLDRAYQRLREQPVMMRKWLPLSIRAERWRVRSGQ